MILGDESGKRGINLNHRISSSVALWWSLTLHPLLPLCLFSIHPRVLGLIVLASLTVSLLRLGPEVMTTTYILGLPHFSCFLTQNLYKWFDNSLVGSFKLFFHFPMFSININTNEIHYLFCHIHKGNTKVVKDGTI